VPSAVKENCRIFEMNVYVVTLTPVADYVTAKLLPPQNVKPSLFPFT